ncbi:benzoate 1,2-dioxygenase [Klebsiella pneumoniae]|uniref:Benzoate 1,2-dioxygenase n=1 Tax=Klebsiella pneumoniae TaxID=573 RepID=A0A2X3EDN2_KLEPN|nr:benzoate 1,2-dioxygenase [Klebsiella pneumoniae]
MANFDSEKATLVPVRLEEYAGFVLSYESGAGECETQLPGLQDKVLEACPDVHDLKLAARFTTLTRRTGKISSITIWNVTTAVRRTGLLGFRPVDATGTPCTANDAAVWLRQTVRAVVKFEEGTDAAFHGFWLWPCTMFNVTPIKGMMTVIYEFRWMKRPLCRITTSISPTKS